LTSLVTYQLKILSSAVFSVTMLRKSITSRQWLALLLLTLGIAMVQIPSSPKMAALDEEIGPLADLTFGFAGRLTHFYSLMTPQAQVGLIAVLMACVLSGLSGVYFEKVLKTSNVTVWVRNVQMSFYSLFPALFFVVLWKDGADIYELVNVTFPPNSHFS
jgi:UDP-sugar transporter A1/2/3